MNRIFSQALSEFVVIVKISLFGFNGIHKPGEVYIRRPDLQPVMLVNDDHGIGPEPVPPGFRQDDPSLGINRFNFHF
jgi:hypothetical protein